MTLDIVIFGLSIRSSWGNGHASTYRALIKALDKRGHRVTFLERDAPWYSENCDLASWPYCRIETYKSLIEVPGRFGSLVAGADLVMLGSFVPSGETLGDWITMNACGVTAFYDIDTPITLEKLEEDSLDYLSPALIPRFDLYLSFTGGPVLQCIEERYGSPRARPLYCAVDPELHMLAACPLQWDLGYLGTYSDDRQPTVDKLLIETARQLPRSQFVIAGAQYPEDVEWPVNVEHVAHLPPASHAEFYSAQRFTLNVTRSAMIEMGYSPSVRLFEAAASGVPIISDRWPGLDTFLMPGKEILIADSTEEVLRLLADLPEDRRMEIAGAARKKVLCEHTADHRAKSLEAYVSEAACSRKTKLAEGRLSNITMNGRNKSAPEQFYLHEKHQPAK